MNVTLQEQLAAESAVKQAAMVEFMHAALHGQTATVANQAVAALDIGDGPTTTDLVHILIAAARGANVSDQSLALLGRIAMQHSEFNAGF